MNIIIKILKKKQNNMKEFLEETKEIKNEDLRKATNLILNYIKKTKRQKNDKN